jgi:hypothetical protein
MRAQDWTGGALIVAASLAAGWRGNRRGEDAAPRG